MFTRLLASLIAAGRAAGRSLRRCLLAAGTLADLARDTPALIAENALLRQQLIVLRRSVKRPRCTPADRALLVLLASASRLGGRRY